MDRRIWSMWLSGKKVMLLCGYCATRNTFAGGKCENCGAKATAPETVEKYAVWNDNLYFPDSRFPANKW